MPKLNKKLTETEIRNAKPKDKDYKLFDDQGLRLLVRRSGTKVWQYPFRLNGKENIYTIGQYSPTDRPGFIGSAEARKLRDEAKALVRQGINPNELKKTTKNSIEIDPATTFEAVAREWHSKQIWTPKHSQNILMTLEKDVFPSIGSKPIDKITVPDIIKILEAIEAREALDVAKRVNQRCTAIFEYAIVKGLCDINPATGRSKAIRGRETKHRPHLDDKYLPEFLNALENYRGSRKVALAMKLMFFTLARPGEIRGAKWNEFDLNNAEWAIPKERMKMKRPHLVPLPVQAINLLTELKQITGKCDLLFPSEKRFDQPISDVTLTKMLIIMGFHEEPKKLVPHGARGTASTILNESRKFRGEVIEMALSHVDNNKIRGAYNHAKYLDERREMLQWWADYMDQKRCYRTETIND